MQYGQKTFDWVVVGGGVAGLAIAEVLSRAGLSTLVLEKNSKLASETSGYFHEWFHSGALYTLLPDSLLTTRYLLGAIDDGLEYFSHFPHMNLRATSCGLSVVSDEFGWYNNDHIEFRFKNRPLNIPWSLMTARSTRLIEEIKRNDWLRRRGGSLFDSRKLSFTSIVKSYPLRRTEFNSVQSPDFTINSRILLNDLVTAIQGRGGVIKCDSNVSGYRPCKSNLVEVEVLVNGLSESVTAKNLVICAASANSKFFPSKIDVSYAPMFVLDQLPENQKSFVELDYRPANCINLLNKGNGVGLAGGISLKDLARVGDYMAFCQRAHLKRAPHARVVGEYVGVKQEVVEPGQTRNYLYHIDRRDSNVWSVVLGKFSLFSSLSVEFFRRANNYNPPKTDASISLESEAINPLIASTRWSEILSTSMLRSDV